VCPFLDDSAGKCLEYAYRPVACRTYGFYVERDRGLYRAKIEAMVDRGECSDVIWGNQSAIDPQLESALSSARPAKQPGKPAKLLLSLLLLPVACLGWHTVPHRTITRAAFDTLPARMTSVLGVELENLIEHYSLLPDVYVETERFGFARKGPGPREPAQLKIYCLRPDGEPLHSAVWNRAEDLDSVVYLYERILSSLGRDKPQDAAIFFGVLAHFIEDSLSPPHAATPAELKALTPAEAGPNVDLHALIERSIPALDLRGRTPQRLGQGIREFVLATLDRLYQAAEENRKNLSVILRAAHAGDEKTLDVHRLRAAKAAAEFFADAAYTLFGMASQ
jgi:hypothetical protein